MNRMFCAGCPRDGVTPIDQLTGFRPDVSRLRILGCTTFVNIPSQFCADRLDFQALYGVIFYHLDAAFRIYIAESGRILISKDVRTIEEPISLEIGVAPDDLEKHILEKYITLPKRDIEEPMDEDYREVEHRQVDEMQSVTHYRHL